MKYSCVYDAAGKLLEIGPAGAVWFRSNDPNEAKKFQVKDNQELSDAAAAAMKLIATSGGGDGLTKTAVQLAEAKVVTDAAAAKVMVDAVLPEITAAKPAAEASK